jgi:hypothetical protein
LERYTDVLEVWDVPAISCGTAGIIVVIERRAPKLADEAL